MDPEWSVYGRWHHPSVHPRGGFRAYRTDGASAAAPSPSCRWHLRVLPESRVWNLSISIAMSSGGELGAIVDMCQPLLEGAEEGEDPWRAEFLAEWVRVAERLIALAREDVGRRRMMSAGPNLLRAALYLLTAERMHSQNPSGRKEISGKARQAFDAGVRHAGETSRGSRCPTVIRRSRCCTPASKGSTVRHRPRCTSTDRTAARSRCSGRSCHTGPPHGACHVCASTSWDRRGPARRRHRRPLRRIPAISGMPSADMSQGRRTDSTVAACIACV